MSDKRYESFAAICAATGKNEQDYIIPADASNEVKAIICQRRLHLIAKAFNGDRRVRFADTSQYKYTPWHRIIPDTSGPFGFRLSFNVYDYAYSYSTLGARPPFLDSDDAVYVGTQFIEEFEQWNYYIDLAYQE